VLALISAPSNLGLRPPQPGAVPGTAKAPEALREAGLHARFAALGAADAGVVLPGRYLDDARAGLARSRNQDAVLDHAWRLADRIGGQLDAGRAPLVLGGDCSLLIGAGRALRPRGRYGLVHLDGHTDFRHPGNSAECLSLAGEDLAAAVGLHWPAITGGRPFFVPADTVHAGCRADDEHLAEVSGVIALVIPARRVRQDGAAATAGAILATVAAARLRSLAGPDPRPSLLHGDAQQNNFVSTAAGAVVIDAAPYFGHPEADLALVDYFEPVLDDLFAGYRDIAPIDPGFAGRRELWRLAAYLAVIAVDGDRPFGRRYLDRLAAAVQAYR
jgi:arginase